MTRQEARVSHYEMGMLLAIVAWRNEVDCLVVGRNELSRFCGVNQFRDSRVSWLKADIKAWFPYVVVLSTENAFASLWISRFPIDSDDFNHPMSDLERLINFKKTLPSAGILEINIHGTHHLDISRSISAISRLGQEQDFDMAYKVRKS